MNTRNSFKEFSWSCCLSGLAALFLVLAGCGGSGKDATRAETTAPEAAPKAEAASGYVVHEAPGGNIAGRVLLNGKPLAPRAVVVNQDAAVCGKQREIYPVRLAKGGIVDAVVWIDGIQQGKPFAFPEAQLEQKGCAYSPHIVLMQPGELKIGSQDPVPHNVHSYSQSNREYNESMNQLRRNVTLRLVRPERVSVRCDLHGWMQAYVVVAADPYYAISRESGAFELTDVPPGRYHLRAWQESLGELSQDVVVEAGKTAKVDFTFDSKSAQGVK